VSLNTLEFVPPLHWIWKRRRIGALSLFLASIIIFTFPVFPVLAGTKIVRHWVLTGKPLPKLEKILVIAVLENYLIRQEFEDEMERLLTRAGIQGIKSHMVLPPRNELMEGELKERIKEGDFDGVLVIRPKAFRKETEELATSAVGFHYMPPAGYYNFWPYWNMAWGQVYTTSSFVKENTIVSAEFNLYCTANEELLWSGETDTVYSKDFAKLGKEYANTLVKQLKKDKVIGKK
jgi:hypothetical protein